MGHFKLLLLTSVMLIPVFFPALLEGGKKANVVVDKSADGEQVVLRRGQTLEVQLEQAGATGYTWQVVVLDENLLESTELASPPPGTGSMIVGAPVLRTWRFKALAKGQTELKMFNYRPWEGVEKAVDKFQLKIKIQ